MKTQKLRLEIDDDDEITIGLLRLAKEVPDYELFYQLNLLNPNKFRRVKDLVFNGNYYDYHFPTFETFHHDSQVYFRIIANKSNPSILKKESTELFATETDNKYLIEKFDDVDYIIIASEPFDDFSVILLPENLLFKIQEFHVSSTEEFYHLIQYYE